MNALHSLMEYLDVLRAHDLLLSHTLSEDDLRNSIETLTYDTREVSGKSLFICKGAGFREEYLSQAASLGACAYVSELHYTADIPAILVSDVREAMVWLGRLFYNDSVDLLTSVGITGTKGKSTTAFYLRAIVDDCLSSRGIPCCGILSSIENYDGIHSEEAHLTTPESLVIARTFRTAHDAGVSHFVMEVSSQALKYRRVGGMRFDVGCFLNIGLDHISPIEHNDFEDYLTAKLRIFDHCRTACVNSDSDHAARILDYARERCERVITFGTHEGDDVFCKNVEKRDDGIFFTVRTREFEGEFSISMPGLFNVSNALCAIAAATALGIPQEHIRSGLRRAVVNGRMQIFESRDRQVCVIVDYAHNRMSFEALFASVRAEFPSRHIAAVFGCPGGKALQRRRDLGEVAGQNADFVYITEDDPANEAFSDIAADIAQYVACPHVILEDRDECVRRAIFETPTPCVVLLAGKGAETCQKRAGGMVTCLSDAQSAQRHLLSYDNKEDKT